MIDERRSATKFYSYKNSHLLCLTVTRVGIHCELTKQADQNCKPSLISHRNVLYKKGIVSTIRFNTAALIALLILIICLTCACCLARIGDGKRRGATIRVSAIYDSVHVQKYERIFCVAV